MIVKSATNADPSKNIANLRFLYLDIFYELCWPSLILIEYIPLFLLLYRIVMILMSRCVCESEVFEQFLMLNYAIHQ